MTKFRVSAVAMGIAVAAAATGAATPAFAGHVKTFVVVTYNNATPPNPITVTNVAPTATVNVTLDTTLTGIANGGATIKFNVDAPPGLEGQTSGAQVNVQSSGFSTSGGGNPPGHDRPAAPAVANGFLNTSTQTDACKAAYNGDKNWHGEFIRDVAKWQAANHLGKAKDDTTRFPLDTDWIAYVQNEVNTLCS